MRFGNFYHRRFFGRESGYMLLLMVFMAAMLVIALLATAPRIAQQIKRDREEEMIHRGAQYARAIKKYFKKFGRYPANLDALENTNNLRFLRKRYKDPMSPEGQWRLVRFGEVQFGRATGSPGQPAPGQPGSGQSTFGASSFGQVNLPAASGASGSRQPNPSGTAFGSTAGSGGSGQAFGGGAIIGVASVSEAESLKEFDGKNHYKDWRFIYDPMIDPGKGLISGPYNPKLPGMTATQPLQPGTQQPGTQSPFQPTLPSGAGNPPGMGQPNPYAPPNVPLEAPK